MTTALLVYAAGVVLLILLNLLAIFSFIRYRFIGDKTFFFIIVSSIVFIATIVSTLALTRTRTNTTPSTAIGVFQ